MPRSTSDILKKYGVSSEQEQAPSQPQAAQPENSTAGILAKYGIENNIPSNAAQPKPANPYFGASVAYKAAADYLNGDAVDAAKRQQLLQQATNAMNSLPLRDLKTRQSMKDVISDLNERAAYDGQAIFAQRKEQNDQATGTYKNALWQMLGLASKASTSGLTEDEVRQQMALAGQMKQAREQVKEANKVIEWDGRDELVKEYQRTRPDPSTVEFDPDYDAKYKRSQELLEQIRQGDIIAGNGVRDIDGADRMTSVLAGGQERIGAGLANLVGTVGQALEEADWTGTGGSVGMRVQEQRSPEEQQAIHEAAEARWSKVYDVADSWSADAAADVDRAKNGLGVFGQAAVDVGGNIMEMAFDAGVGLATGGSSLVPMFLRVAGGGMQEARQAGANLDQQMLYGLSSAAVEVATEKMFDGVARIYGAGAFDNLTEALIRRLTSSPTGQTFLRVLVDASDEGVEELISGFVSPALDAIYKDGTIREQYAQMDSSELVYDAIIGGVVGLLGGGTSIASGQNRAANAENAQWNRVYEGLGEQPTLGRELRDRSLMNRVQENPDAYNPENRTTLDQQATDAMQALARGQSEADRAAAIQQQRKSSADRAMELLGLKPAETRVNGQPILTPQNQHERIVYDLLTHGELTEEKAELILQNQALEMAVEDIGQIKLDGLSHEEKMQALLETYGNAAESTEAADHESVPEGSQDSSEAPSDAFNTQENAGTAEEGQKPQVPTNPLAETALEKQEQNRLAERGKNLTDKVAENIPQMEQTQPVAKVDGTELPAGKRASDRMLAFIKNLGGKVSRSGFGDVLFSRSKIKGAVLHGASSPKIDVFAAVPAVIQNGVQIDHQTNWNGKNVDTYVFAAPVEYKGQRTYVGVVVQQDAQSNQYYVHEVVDGNGNLIYNAEAPLTASAPTTVSQDSVQSSAPISEASTDIVQQDAEGVNGALQSASTDGTMAPPDAVEEAFARMGINNGGNQDVSGIGFERESNERDRGGARSLYVEGPDGGQDSGKHGPSGRKLSQQEQENVRNQEVERIKQNGGRILAETEYTPELREAIGLIAALRPGKAVTVFEDPTMPAGSFVYKDAPAAGIFLNAHMSSQASHAQEAVHESGHLGFAEKGIKAATVAAPIIEQNLGLLDAYEYAFNRYKRTYQERYTKALYGEDAVFGDLMRAEQNEVLSLIHEELLNDLSNGNDRAFPAGIDISPLVKATQTEFQNRGILDFERARDQLQQNGIKVFYAEIESDNTKDGRWMNDVPDEAEQHQPGENKSNRESLLASEPAETEQAEESPETDTEYETRKAQQEADENREANDYEERRKAGKLTEEEKAAAKAKAKERHGEKRNDAVDKIAKKLADWGEKWTKIAGETTVEEDGTETTTSNEANLAAAVQGYADGTVSAQELLEAYEGLNSDGKLSYDSLFYFDKVAGNLTRLANLESELNYLEANNLAKGEDYEKLKNDFAQSSEQALKCLDTMISRGEKNFDDRKAFRDEVTMNFRVERSGIRGTFDKAKAWYYRIQQNPRLFFEWLGGFDKKNSKTSYKFAQRVDKAQLKQISVRQSALTYFADVVKMKGYSDLETGKTKGTVDIPGLGKLSLNYELSLLKTLETAGAIEHIVKNGADFAVESDYYANRNNGGFGQTKSFPNQLDIRAMGDAILEKKGIKKPKAEDIEAARTEALNNLKDELRKDVMGNDVAKAAYEASVKAMRYLARELNITSTAMYGYGFALGGNTYWPIESVGKRQNSEAKKASVYDIEDSSFTHRRSGPSGKLRIRPFVEVMSSYSNRASIYAAWAELRSDLHMMDTAVGNDTETFASILELYGEPRNADKHVTSHTAAEYYSRWLKTIDGDMDANSSFLGKLRSNLAQSSLTLNAGVALKQTPSYWDAAGEIDYDILLKNWRPVKSARSYDTNPLLAEVNKRTGLLESRKIGYNAVEMGDAADAAHSLGGKVVGKLPSWMTNWINKMDYRTVSNLALAAAAQVERNNPNLTKGSNAYYNAVVETFERAVLHSQPIYNAQYRAENLRSSNEIVRSLSMFRTQQTQNFNQQAEAWGEYLAARENGDKEATKEARRHLTQVVGGQVTGSVLFAVLSSIARMLNHRTKDYEDEEGHLSGEKVAGRLALDMVESVAATAWFGDTVAAIAIDGLSNAVTGGKGTSEFYSLSESTTQLVSDAATGLISATKTLFNPDKTAAQKGKAANDFAKNLASACGIPLGNAYNLINSAMMFYTDAQHKNVGNYDDVYKRVAEYSASSESARAGRTAEQAIVYFGRGDKNRADAALSTLDYSSKKVSSTVQSSMKQAYEDGKIDEKTLRSILTDYCGLDSEDLEKVMDTAAIDIAYNEEKEADKKTFDAVEALLANVVDKKRDDDRPTDYYKMDAIISTMLNEKQIDTVVDKQMNQDYRANYNALRGAGMSPKKTAELLETLDTDQNGGVNQNEMYNYFLTHTGEEKYISKLWNAQGYDGDNTRTWSAFKASRKNMEYDTLKAQNEGNATFTALEQQMKDLKSDSSFMLQNAGSDKAIFDKIIGGGFSDSETDAAVKQYVSSDGRAYYSALRDKGLSPSDAVDLINEIDGYATKNGKPNNGSIAIDELMEFYKAHPDQEDLAIALYYTTDRKYTWEEQKKKKKVK